MMVLTSFSAAKEGGVAAIDTVLPVTWQTDAAYIAFVLVITIALRIGSLLLQVLQTRQFTLIAKDLIFRMRARLIDRLNRVSMAEYESLGHSPRIADIMAASGIEHPPYRAAFEEGLRLAGLPE